MLITVCGVLITSWSRAPQERFLSGAEAEHFDYTIVDNSSRFDVSKERVHDDEDAYFADDGDAGVAGDTSDVDVDV